MKTAVPTFIFAALAIYLFWVAPFWITLLVVFYLIGAVVLLIEWIGHALFPTEE